MSVAGRLEGRTAIVVGAGQTPGETIGNGRAIAVLFARAGAEVLCADLHLDRAEETAAQIREEGGKAAAATVDVRDRQSCAALIADAAARWERIDILVNNVGIGGGGDAPAHRADPEALDRIIDVNLKGAWRAIAAVVPAMREKGGGAIVNISSLAARAGGNMVAYEMSKAGLDRLTAHVALSNAKYGIRCNAVAPGLMDTPMAIVGTAAALGIPAEEVRRARNARVPLGGRMGTAWDTAHAVLFLASDQARFVTGAVLPVDGGGGLRAT
ncbi:SDR family NAD(P)-dependent oxidoreductase [Minwuia thermotolerans]|uniref:3-oxoacyl-ACP reductase n=1 Tax=Minwuia thermotolerans TaxID=2056226 RepID=A0A2M9FVL7_9PROT|nr:SDR family NAD(P)-dependent oxidoreductase [Minwuia thermotolerans]PJK27506.1 3-oxoacyl-ACP reductase [Minwuia thermotolerans]